MYRIGITGGIATGKSTVVEILKSLGAQVVDADEIARDLTKPGGLAAPAIMERFGTLDRRALADIIFTDDKSRADLNAIVHPLVRQQMEAIIFASDEKIIVMDIPLLYESNMESIADEVWVVHVPEHIQLARLMARNALTQAEALARIYSQMPTAEKLEKADASIDNSGTIDHTRKRVEALWKRVQGKAGLCP